LPSEASADQPTVAGYEILAELGRGGMGVVYKARQVTLGRVVALKMILAGGHAGEADLARFRTEAEAIARLQHPNIVQIHEVGEHEGLPFFSLEFCGGGSLQKKSAGAPMQPKEAAPLVETLARAMQAAHDRGIIHRDLKPANVLLAEDGMPKITDFGLAKKLDTPGATSTGVIMGTPSYMAPEQAGGKNRAVGPPADVYALGAILYELLTGRPPFKAPTAVDTLIQVVTDDPVPVRRLQPKVPRDLETICHKCLRKEPGQRYASAKALAEDLRRFLAGVPILARPIGSLERGIKWTLRRPALAALVAVSCLATVTLVVVILDANVRLTRERDHARDQEKKVGVERDNALQAKAEADRQRNRAEEMLSHTRAERGMRLLEGGNLLGLLDLLEARRAAEELPQLRDPRTILWSGWETACSGRLEQVLPNKSPVTGMAFSPDGKTVATREQNGAIVLWDFLAGEARVTIRTPESWTGRELTFAPDSKALSFRWNEGGLSDGTWKTGIQAWDVATGHPLCSPVQAGSREEKVCLSPDGRWFVSCAGATLQKRDAPTGNPVGSAWKAAGPVEALLLSPDGRLLVTLGDELEWWDPATGRQCAPSTPILNGKGQVAFSSRSLAFSPNSKWLICRVATFETETVRVHDAATGKPFGEPVTAKMEYGSTQVSPDGATLATVPGWLSGGLREGSVRLWRTATGKAHGEALRHEGAATCLAFSPDGRLVATGGMDGTARLWEVETGRPHGSSLWHPGRLFEVAFAPDGSLLATLDESGTVRLWQTAVPTPRGKPALEVAAYGFAFGPGGNWLAATTENQICRWDLTNLQPVGKRLEQENVFGPIACSPDGVLLAAATEKGIQLWDIAAGQRHGSLLEFPHHADGLAFSLDGKWLAAMSGEGVVQMWDPVTGKLHDPPFKGGGAEAAFFDLQISADGKLVATRSTFGLFLWRADTGQEFPPPQKQIMAMNLEGKVLVAPADGSGLSLQDPLTGETLKRLPGAHFSPIPPEFSPDGKLVATPDADQTVQLWDMATGKQYGPRLVNRQQIQRVVFSPDGKVLVTVAPGGTLRLWDVGSGQQLGPAWQHLAGGILPLEILSEMPVQVAFSPDGRWLATQGGDMHLRLWPVPKAALPLREMELRTWLSLGVRLDAQGGWQSIPGPEWQALRRELGALIAQQ
jgi:WD40 repeat protein